MFSHFCRPLLILPIELIYFHARCNGDYKVTACGIFNNIKLVLVETVA